MCNEQEEKNWLEVENTDAELLAAATAYQKIKFVADRKKFVFKYLLAWLVLSGGLYFLITHVSQTFLDTTSFCVGFVLSAIVLVASLRKQQRAIVRQYQHHYRICPQAQGLEIVTDSTHTLHRWTAIQFIEQRDEAIVLHLKGYRILWVPTRCFKSPQDCQDWLSLLEHFSGIRASKERFYPALVPEQRGMRTILDFGSNLYAGLLFMLFRPAAAQRLRVSTFQVVLFALVSFLLHLGFMFMTVGLKGQFYWPALPGLFMWLPCSLFSAWVITRQTSQPERIPTAILVIQTPLLITQVVSPLLTLGISTAFPSITMPQLTGLILAWTGIAVIVALIRSLHLLRSQWLFAILGVGLLVGVPIWLHNENAPSLWMANYDDETSEDTPSSWEQATQEAVLYAQPALLDQAINAVQKGKPGVPELYLLALAGYGEQDVFLREARSVTQLFKERFGTEGHSITLINNPATTQEYPLASTIALRKSLAAIGSKMNKDEDVLFLFMTSHGAEDFHFSLDLWPYKFGELTPQTLRSMLDDEGIKNRVILVSACYSGGFVKPLANDDTLVMSASREDRNSHGCSHEAEWTFFGKAYFNEALRQTHSFEQAFAMASKTVAQRETKEDLKHSEPQIAVGKAIRPVLEKLEKYQTENAATRQ